MTPIIKLLADGCEKWFYFINDKNWFMNIF